jgi:hypothetical protein
VGTSSGVGLGQEPLEGAVFVLATLRLSNHFGFFLAFCQTASKSVSFIMFASGGFLAGVWPKGQNGALTPQSDSKPVSAGRLTGGQKSRSKPDARADMLADNGKISGKNGIKLMRCRFLFGLDKWILSLIMMMPNGLSLEDG